MYYKRRLKRSSEDNHINANFEQKTFKVENDKNIRGNVDLDRKYRFKL
jgi:hypothetical protein